MKNTHNKSDSEILRQQAEELLKEKSEAKILELIEELAFQNEEKTKRADELLIANKELAFQNEEKAKRADELIIANKELAFQNEEKTKRADELIIANKELAFQNEEKTKRADELVIANKELAFQNEEKTKRADELVLANKELAFQNDEKIKRAAELIVAKEEIAFQSELLIANKELAFQNEEKTKRTDELVLANKELAFQNEEKIKRAAELIAAKEEVAFQSEVLIANNKALKLSQELEAHQIELEVINDNLKQSEQRYQALVEWSPYAALVHRDMKIEYVNPAAVKLFGANSEHDLLGTDVMRWHHPDYHQIVRERIRRAAEDGLAAPMIESKYFKLDGTVMDLEVQGKPIIYNGLPSILATFNDVTESRRFERQLKERLKEIEILYNLSQLSEREDLPLTALYQELIDFLPKGWQYSEIACSRIVIDGVEYRSKNFEDSAWKLSAPLLVNKAIKGMIEVAYLKEMPKEDEGPFLQEERKLINAIAQQLGKIIEQKNAEEEKARQSSLIKSLLDSIPDVIFFKDIEGVYLGGNPTFFQVVGKSKEDIIGKTDYDLYEKEIADVLKANDSDIMAQKSVIVYEELVPLSTGEKVLFETRKSPFSNGHGVMTGIVGVSRDITERKEAENKLRASEIKFSKIFNNSPDMIILASVADRRTVEVNDTFLQKTGLSRDEVIGRTFGEVRVMTTGEKHTQIAEALQTNDKITGLELTMKGEDGSVIKGVFSRDIIDLGDCRYFLTVITDITQLKKAEKERALQSALINSLLDSIPDIIFFKDMEGVYLGCNPAFVEFVDKSRKEIIGKTDYDLFDKEVADFFKHHDNEMLKHKLKRHNEEWVTYPDGRKILLDTVKTPYWAGDGSLIGILGISRDITEKQEANELLQQTRQNYETFFNTIDDFLFVLDKQGNIIHTNSTVIDRLGYIREELVGKSVLMIHPSERRDEAGRIVGEMLNGTAEFCPVPIMTKSGIQIAVETRVSHGFWDGTSVIFGVTKDITKIKLSEEKFSKLFHLNPSACGLSDIENHEYIEVNEAFYKLFGFDKNEVIGKTATELGLLTPETINAILANSDSNGIVTNAEAGLKAKNGDIKKVILSSENIYVQDKEYRFTVVNDITKLKQAEESLRLSEEKFRTVIDYTYDWEYWVGTDDRIIYTSPSCERISGYKQEDFLSDQLLLKKIVHPGDATLFNDHDMNIHSQNHISEFDEFDFRIIKKDGSVVHIGHLCRPISDDKGNYLGRRISNRDITARIQVEEEIKLKNQELHKLNAEKDKFFSIISHDLRGPFNGFLGLSKLLADELPALTQEEIQKMAVAMKDSATNLFRLLENLLEWSRLQRGITSFEPGQFILMPMITETMRPVMVSANKKEIEIKYEIPDYLQVFADQYMLASTIRNLASNAVKFTIKGGKVTIAAKAVPGNSVEFSVMDTGIGMSPQMVDNLFRLDVQTNRRGTENEPSSGLGLLLCKDFVEKHGGKLWVESEEGKGSVFYFTIPYHAKVLMKKVITNSVSEEEKEVQIKRMKILIAEDDEISDSLISAMVDKYSHDILHVKTGVDAIHACRNNPDIDLVLMDINLIGMNGYEATRQIRQFNNDVVIIAQTAFSLKYDRVMAIEAGCNDYINKPISISELKGLIRKYFTI